MRGLLRLRLARAVASLLCAGWGVAWAAVDALQQEPDLIGLPWLQIAAGCAIASWGGMAATLGRYVVAQYDAKPFHWRSEAVRDGVNSVAVGFGGYVGGLWYGMGPALLGLCLLLGGFAGTFALQIAARYALKTFERVLRALSGGS